jgi:cellulose synthase (UDP-forming)
MFSVRLWGAKRLMRNQIHWPTAFALRVFRVPVGMACLWWLVTRRRLQFEVTPKGGAEDRQRGEPPAILWALSALVAGVLGYATLGVAGVVPWRTTGGSTTASGLWLGIAGLVLLFGAKRIRAAEYATSRRNAYRVELPTEVILDDFTGSLVDVSVGGAAVRFPAGTLPGSGLVSVELPGAAPMKMEMVRTRAQSDNEELASLRIAPDNWAAYRTMSLWMFHTPAYAVPQLPAGVPVVAYIHPT